MAQFRRPGLFPWKPAATKLKTNADAIVVGSGPNGLAAAITLARHGQSVLLLEANDRIGGSVRSEELTLPGFLHDVCSSVFPMALASPFFRTLPLEKLGLRWIHSEFAFAHPFDDGSAAVAFRSVTDTAAQLRADKKAYIDLFSGLAEQWRELAEEFLQPLIHAPRHPLLVARFGLKALRSASGLIAAEFETREARALFAGACCHSFLPLEERASAAIGLMLTVMAHSVGWPIAAGGSQKITEALASEFLQAEGEIETNQRVEDIKEVTSRAKLALLDVTPAQFLKIAGARLPASPRRALERYQYGPGVFKIDYALSEPIPWRSPECLKTATVHLGGSFEEIALSESRVARGGHPEKPFVLVVQPSLFDTSRTPAGKHTAWAYCHVPNGSAFDMSARIESQIERFAPGFRDCVLARNASASGDLQKRNANLVGGDINGGLANLRQMLFRPVARWNPYATPLDGVYLCSASTPPGGAVHGMCGFNAARAALTNAGYWDHE